MSTQAFLAGLVRCAPTLEVQLSLLMGISLFWMLALRFLGRSVLEPWIESRRWGAHFLSNWRYANKRFGIDYGGEDLRASAAFMTVVPQHIVGGLLALPAALPSAALLAGLSSETSTALLRMAGLSEAGWELQDLLIRAYELLFLAHGRKLNPPLPLAVALTHHILGLSMVIPMNVFFAHRPDYAELVLVLQLVSAVGVSIQLYVLTLDTTKRFELRQLQFLATLAMVLFIYARGFRFTVLGNGLLAGLAPEHPRMYRVGRIAFVAMFFTNVVIILDAVERCAKHVGGRRLGIGLAALAKRRQTAANSKNQ